MKKNKTTIVVLVVILLVVLLAAVVFYVQAQLMRRERDALQEQVSQNSLALGVGQIGLGLFSIVSSWFV